MVVLLVGLLVLGQPADALRQESNLYLGRSGVGIAASVLANEFLFAGAV